MVVAIIPAYNEEKTIGGVILSLRPFVDKIIVVDDGSRDTTAERAVVAGAEVLRHQINRGQGAALETGRQAALMAGGDIIVTFDADGQFDATEIPALLAPIKTGECDVVLGSRFLKIPPSPRILRSLGLRVQKGDATVAPNLPLSERGTEGDLVSADKKSDIPPLRRLLLKFAVIFTRLTTGLKITDTHNGFRAFSRLAAERINITQDRMAHASEILETIARLGLKYKEVPVTVRYTDYSLRKGQKLSDTIKIIKDLFWGRLL